MLQCQHNGVRSIRYIYQILALMAEHPHPLAEIDGGAHAVVRLGDRRALLATLPEATFFRRYRDTFGS